MTFPLDVDTVQLPPLPAPASADDPISLISCGDDFILALTKAGKLFHLDLSPVPPAPGQRRVPPGAVNDPYDSPIRSRESRSRLEAAFLSGARAWTYLRRFCDMGEVARLEGVNATGETRITHVSAHFESFAACTYNARCSPKLPTSKAPEPTDSVPSTSDPAGSVVLLGRKGYDAQSKPVVMPELQDIGVIKCISLPAGSS